MGGRWWHLWGAAFPGCVQDVCIFLFVETHSGSFSTAYKLLHKAYSSSSCFCILLERHLYVSSRLLCFNDTVTVTVADWPSSGFAGYCLLDLNLFRDHVIFSISLLQWLWAFLLRSFIDNYSYQSALKLFIACVCGFASQRGVQSSCSVANLEPLLCLCQVYNCPRGYSLGTLTWWVTLGFHI